MSHSFTSEATKVQTVIADIRRSCEELLDKNVDSIKKLAIGRLSTLFIFKLS